MNSKKTERTKKWIKKNVGGKWWKMSVQLLMQMNSKFLYCRTKLMKFINFSPNLFALMLHTPCVWAVPRLRLKAISFWFTEPHFNRMHINSEKEKGFVFKNMIRFRIRCNGMIMLKVVSSWAHIQSIFRRQVLTFVRRIVISSVWFLYHVCELRTVRNGWLVCLRPYSFPCYRRMKCHKF